MTDPTSLSTATPAGDSVAESHGSGHFGYKPALDGIRTVAVMSVVAYHFGAGWLQGGFLGVDTFFVLSGYLITSLLLLEWRRTDTIHFGGFWARRARRLLPALFLVLIAIAIWGRLAMHSDEWGDLRTDSLWFLFYGANWHFISSGASYFSTAPSLLRHGWSLAIEEQFYLVWPLVVFACLRISRGRHVALAVTCVVGSVASIAFMWTRFREGADPSRVYYGTDARASQLLIGALLAILLVHWAPKVPWSKVVVQVLGVVGALGMAYAFWAARDQSPRLYRGGFTVFAVLVALVLTAVVQPTSSPLHRVLCLRPIRWIGMISYGIYLWHWPVAVALSPARLASWGWAVDGWRLAVVRLAVTFAIAAASFYLVEKPIRERRFVRSLTPKLLVPAGFAVVVAVILIGTVGATRNQLDAAPGTALGTDSSTPTVVPNDDPDSVSRLTQRTLLIGDSVAYTLANALAAEFAADGVTFRAATRLGCGMTTGVALDNKGQVISWSPGCANGTVAFQDQALAANSPDTVLWLSTWELSDYRVGDQTYRFGTPAWEGWLRQEIERVHAAVAARGARLVLVQLAPRAPNPLIPDDPSDPVKIARLNRLFADYAATHPADTTVVDLGAIVCPGGTPCPTKIDGIVLRPKDGGHFEADGAAWVSPRLVEAIRQALLTQRRP